MDGRALSSDTLNLSQFMAKMVSSEDALQEAVGQGVLASETGFMVASCLQIQQ